MNATIRTDKISVRVTTLGLEAEVPNGWDDVKNLVNKVLEFDGRTFTFFGWNSDRNVCFFRPAVAATIR
jgi:hypothetical protein